MSNFAKDYYDQREKKMGRSMLTLAGIGGGMYALKSVLVRSVREFAAFERNMVKVSTMLDEQTMYLENTEMVKCSLWASGIIVLLIIGWQIAGWLWNLIV